MRTLTYCSLVKDSVCQGVVILEGAWDPVQSYNRITELGIDPGGQLLAVSCCETDIDLPPNAFTTMAANTNRLIPEAEARVLFEAKSITEHELETEWH